MTDKTNSTTPRDADEQLADYGPGALRWEGQTTGGLDGVTVLSEVVDEVALHAEDRTRRAQPLVGLMEDLARFDAVVEAWRGRAVEVEAQLVRLASVQGMQRPASQLRQQLIRAAADDQGLRLVGDEAESVEIRAAVRWADYPEGVVVPDGWHCTRGMLWRYRQTSDGQREKVAIDRPVLVRRVLVDLETRDWSLELRWYDRGQWRREIVPREQALDIRGIVRLAARGLPVSSVSARYVVQWLAGMDRQAEVPRAYSTAQLGWLGRGTTHYLCGRALVAPEGDAGEVFFTASAGAEQYADGFRSGGSWAGWCGIVSAVAGYPSMMAAVHGAAAAPLLRVIGAPNFGLDWAGRSGTGKSTALRLGVSLGGSPEGRAMGTWSGTLAGKDGLAATSSDLPLSLNEGQLITDRDKPAAGAMLYQLIEGKSRQKGSLGRMGQERVETFRTVVLSSSEEGITSWSAHEGVRARILVLRGYPLPAGSAALSDWVQVQTGQHYGHVLPRLVRHLVDLGEPGQAELRAHYEALRDDLRGQLDPMDPAAHMAGRAAQYVAAMRVAGEILHGPLGVPVPTCDVYGWMWERVMESCGGGDRGRAALEWVWSWCLAHGHEFALRRPDSLGPPVAGWAGLWLLQARGYLAVRPEVMERVLRDGGFADARSVLSDWKGRGWMLARGRRLNHECGLPGGPKSERSAHYCVTQEAIDGLTVAEPAEPDSAPPDRNEIDW